MSQIISYKCDRCQKIIERLDGYYEWGKEGHICQQCFIEQFNSRMTFLEQVKTPAHRMFSSHGALNFAIDHETGFAAPINGSKILPFEEFKELVESCFSFYENSDEWTRIHLLLDSRWSHNTRKEQQGFVYLARGIEGDYAGCYKIGKSTDPKFRIGAFKKQYQTSAELVHTIKTHMSYELEDYLHKRFANKRVKLEWFNLESADIEYICSISK